MNPESQRITIVILAAGGSKRLGGPKQMLLYQGTSMIRHLAKGALDSRAGKVAVVLGAYLETIEQEIESMPVRIIRNEKWEEGMGGSIAMAVESVRNESDAILFTASDQPLVTTPFLNSMIEASRASAKRIIAAEYSETLGIPALFPGKYFDELAALSGDSGAKKIILKHRTSVIGIPFPEGSVDIDQLTDLKKLS